jgi:Alcohol dehydrogenase GroES-like domain
LQILDLEQEPPHAGEVRVHAKAGDVSMPDRHILNGDWPLPWPIVPGPEVAGIVAATGPGVAAVQPGDHVIFSFRPHCGRCSYRSSVRRCCASATTTRRVELNGEPVNRLAGIGTYAEEVVCPAQQAVEIRRQPALHHAAVLGWASAWWSAIRSAHYGLVRPNIDFPIFADLDMEKRSTSPVRSAAAVASTSSMTDSSRCRRARSRAGVTVLSGRRGSQRRAQRPKSPIVRLDRRAPDPL